MFCRHVFGNISGGFRGISGILGNFAGFAEIPEFCGSATTRNIRSPAIMKNEMCDFVLGYIKYFLFHEY